MDERHDRFTVSFHLFVLYQFLVLSNFNFLSGQTVVVSQPFAVFILLKSLFAACFNLCKLSFV